MKKKKSKSTSEGSLPAKVKLLTLRLLLIVSAGLCTFGFVRLHFSHNSAPLSREGCLVSMHLIAGFIFSLALAFSDLEHCDEVAYLLKLPIEDDDDDHNETP